MTHSPTRPIGRPMKYRKFLEILEEDQIYSPATIVRLGHEQGLISPHLEGEALRQAKLNIRHALARYSANHFFPREGDGMIDIPGQPPIRGWFGWRWKADL